MIPQAQIIQWQKHAPWINSIQIEQDLILKVFLKPNNESKLK